MSKSSKIVEIVGSVQSVQSCQNCQKLSNCQIVNTDPRHCIGEYSHCLKIPQCLLHCTDQTTSDVFYSTVFSSSSPLHFYVDSWLQFLYVSRPPTFNSGLLHVLGALLLLLGSGLLLAPASDTAQYTLHNSHMGGPTEKYSSVISSEGALYVILPYDYPQRSAAPTFWTHTGP